LLLFSRAFLFNAIHENNVIHADFIIFSFECISASKMVEMMQRKPRKKDIYDLAEMNSCFHCDKRADKRNESASNRTLF
jgi:predicted nucleotidyltransferase component of viral defense system